MATRFSFAIFGQSTADLATGLSLEIKDSSATVVASTNPASGQSQIQDNNDGTYFVDGLSTGEFTVFVATVQQDELTNVPFIDDVALADLGKVLTTDDLSTTTANDNAKVWGGAILTTEFATKEDVDATILRQANIVNNLTTSSTTTPLSATQGKALQDGKLNISDINDTLTSTSTTVPLSANQGKALQDDKLNIADINNTLTSTSTVQPLSANQGKVLKDALDDHYPTHGGTDVKTFATGDFTMSTNEISIANAFSSTNYLSTSNSLAQNLSTLDSAIYYGQGSGSGGASNARVAIMDIAQENYLDGLVPKDSHSGSAFVFQLAYSAVGASSSYSHVSNTYYILKRISFYKQPWMNQIVWFADIASGASDVEFFLKVACDTLSKESDKHNSTTPIVKGIYLNIDSLSSGKFYNITMSAKIVYTGTGSTKKGTVNQSMVVVKENITSSGGETTMIVNNPVVM
jgi:hypothetical protein